MPQTFSMRVDDELLERIDQSALALNGGNRTAYVLSWLPENYEQPTRPTETGHDNGDSSRR